MYLSDLSDTTTDITQMFNNFIFVLLFIIILYIVYSLGDKHTTKYVSLIFVALMVYLLFIILALIIGHSISLLCIALGIKRENK